MWSLPPVDQHQHQQTSSAIDKTRVFSDNMPPQGAAYNVDWVWSNASNAHVANDIAWFTPGSYRSFETYTTTSVNNHRLPVIGVGNVELNVRVRPNRQGRASNRTIVLHNVLHAPLALCNIFGDQYLAANNVCIQINKGMAEMREPESGRRVALFKRPGNLFSLWLKGQPNTHTSLDPNGSYCINATWPEGEQLKWQNVQRMQAPDPSIVSTSQPSQGDAYTADEKQWLKTHWKNEFLFLRAYGLSIYKEEDREDGRALVRSFMAEEESDASPPPQEGHDFDEDEVDSDDSNDFLADLERDPMSHLADYWFSDEELDWIQTHYRHSGNFLTSYGHHPWEDSERRDAQLLIKTLMHGDQD